jgi:hypothetical protein
MHVSGLFGRIIKYLASTELAVGIFLLIAVIAIPGTLSERSTFYSSPYFTTLLVAFGCNLTLCTIHRFRTIPWPVLVVHVGVLVTLLGCVVKSFGFVATVNTYEDDMAAVFYRWDLEKDIDLGFSVVVKKINREFYPLPIKIGVWKDGKKDSLHVLKTGESFSLGAYRIEAGKLEYLKNDINLAVFIGENRIGSFMTNSKSSDLPPDFPYTFELVAYQDPKLKSEWLDLLIIQDGQVVAEGTSGINSPMIWKEYALHNPGNDFDEDGIPYAGIQVVRDPGVPVVFSGLLIMGIGTLCSSFRRLRKKPSWV